MLPIDIVLPFVPCWKGFCVMATAEFVGELSDALGAGGSGRGPVLAHQRADADDGRHPSSRSVEPDVGKANDDGRARSYRRAWQDGSKGGQGERLNDREHAKNYAISALTLA
jgi:hypothetical protein